ncbi:MAG: N-6 DNA methylase, partial [Methylocella sp.]
MGQVYEQFLGKVIRLTAGHRAVIDDKPEVKKAGGVYYTPTYIVDYIVRHTVGELVEDNTPAEVAKLRVLDPACGSGSFLIGAYQFLLDWHLAWYLRNEPTKWAKGRRQALIQTGTTWRLTIAERKRILIDNIYGVDIDPQAVEVTKLSLLLKVLEGETDQTLQPLLFGLHERALPDLGDNIKCGNSLIGSDFYRQGELPLLNEDERQRINVFDWDGKEGFPEIMNSGGFDAVIENPPYIFTRELLSNAERSYFSNSYSLSLEKHNTYFLFMEAQLRLLRRSGRGSYIVPNSW